MYSCDGKDEFSASLLQYFSVTWSKSHDPKINKSLTDIFDKFNAPVYVKNINKK